MYAKEQCIFLFFKEKTDFVLMKSDFPNIHVYSVSFFIILVLT